MAAEGKLRSASEFRRVFREGRAVSTPHLVIHTAKRADTGSGRYGLVVSKKFGNAVVRNRARRQLRAAVAMAGGIPPGVDSVIVAKPGAQLRVAALAQEIWQIMDEHGADKWPGGSNDGR